MTPLQRLHLLIQEISKENDHIHVSIIMLRSKDNPEVTISHIEALEDMEYIIFLDRKRQKIAITESGKLANIVL